MNAFFVYILKYSDGFYYTGHTFHTRDAAFHVERKIKRWTSKKKEALIMKNWDLLRFLAKSTDKKRSIDPSTSSGRAQSE